MERSPHRIGHAERGRREPGSLAGFNTHFSEAIGDLRGGQLVARGAGGMEMITAAHVENLVQCHLRHLAETIQRQRLPKLGRHVRPGLFPADVIGDVTAFSVPSCPLATLHADRAKAVDADAWPSRFIIQIDAALDELLVRLLDASFNETGSSRRTQEQDPGKSNR